MNFIQQVADWLRPSSVKCNSDLDMHLQAAQMQDEYDAHLPERHHKIPGYEHLFNPVLMATGNYEIIKGFKFEFGLPLSETFITSHAWDIPNSGTVEENPNPMMMQVQQKPTYSFTTQYVHDLRGQEPGAVLMGQVDSEGKVRTIIMKKLHRNLNLKVEGAFQSSNVDQGMVTTELTYQNKDSTTCIKAGEGLYGYSLSQRVHPNLILGFDYNYVTGQQISIWGYGLKAFIRNHSLFANFTGLQNQYNIGYVIPIKKGTQFVAHYKYDAQLRAPCTTLAFKQRYQESEISATVNTKLEVTTSIALKHPMYSLKLCATVDYLKEKYTFGYGISLGQTL